MTHSGFVLGIDGCRAGWLGIALPAGDGGAPRGVFGATLVELAAAAGPVDVVGIDMPLHVTDEPWPRASDMLAKAYLGAKGAALFVTPPLSAYEAPDYATGCAVAKRLTGKAFSKQAWALKVKIMELATWWSPTGPDVREVHPEVSFSLLAGGVIRPSKATWAGLETRRAALAAAGIVVPADLGEAGRRAGADDVLDAAAAAWSARRIAAGTARCFPDVPHELPDGRRQGIWA